MVEKEQTLSESFTITGIGLISLDSDDLEKDDYSLNESIAEFEFKLRNSDDNVSAILKKVKMYIDDSEDFQGIV